MSAATTPAGSLTQPASCPHCGHTKFTKTTYRKKPIWYCKSCTRRSDQPVNQAAVKQEAIPGAALVRPECRERLREILQKETLSTPDWEEIYDLLTPCGRKCIIAALTSEQEGAPA